jgi:hypothetical protein
MTTLEKLRELGLELPLNAPVEPDLIVEVR